MPHASIGSDVIVGFPGETDAHASVLLDYVSGSPLTHVHVFPYSHRPGDGGERAGRHAGAADRAATRAPRCAVPASAWRVRSGPRRPAASAARWWWTTARRPSPTTTCACALDVPCTRNEWIDVEVVDGTRGRVVLH